MELIAKQFRSPKGFLGRLIGKVMAWQNRSLNRKAITQLQIKSDDVILEIGFGSGTAIQQIHSIFPACKIYGVDPSGVMVQEARSLNHSGSEKGNVTLLRGIAEDLPFAENYFTKIFSVSTFHDWNDQATALIEIRRVLKKDGKLLICIRKATKRKWPWSPPGITPQEVEQDLSLLRHAGYRDVIVKTGRWSRTLILSGIK